MTHSFLKCFIRSWKNYTALQVATLTILMATFTVVSTSFLIHQNVDYLLTNWGDNIKVSVFLTESSSPEDRSKIEGFLKGQNEVEQIHFLSKEESIKDFKEKLSGLIGDEIDEAEIAEALPESFEITFSKNVDLSSYLSGLAGSLSNMSGVGEVSYGKNWIGNYGRLVKAFKVSSLFLVTLLFAGSLFVIGNSIRNSISQRMDEIEIMELFGATKWMIRVPFILEGALMGFLSAALALFISYLIFSWQSDFLASELKFWSVANGFKFLSFWRLLFILVIATNLGALGSFLCLRKISFSPDFSSKDELAWVDAY